MGPQPCKAPFWVPSWALKISNAKCTIFGEKAAPRSGLRLFFRLLRLRERFRERLRFLAMLVSSNPKQPPRVCLFIVFLWEEMGKAQQITPIRGNRTTTRDGKQAREQVANPLTHTSSGQENGASRFGWLTLHQNN